MNLRIIFFFFFVAFNFAFATPHSVWIKAGKNSKIKQVTSKNSSTCVITNDQSVKCWGYNGYGQLGRGNTTSVGSKPADIIKLNSIQLGTGLKVSFLSHGNSHVCAIFTTGKVKCWGRNNYGQLGLGDTTDRGDGANEMGNNLPYVDLGTGKTAKTMSTAGDYNCAILNDDTVKCWGYNSVGQLGYGDMTDRGSGANQMGDNLSTVDLGTGKTAKAIAVNGATCAILNDDTVKCWGSNNVGQLGYGDMTDRGGSAGQMGDNLATVDLGTGKTVKKIAGGSSNFCVILNDDTVKCWGHGNSGRLGYESSANKGDGANEMGDNLLAVNLGTGKTAKQISSWDGVSCAILNDDTAKCWGANSNGALGQNNTINYGSAVNQMGDNLPAITMPAGKTPKAISASAHVCVILSDDSLICWGNNNYGQLGQGHLLNIGTGGSTMGDDLPYVSLGTGKTASSVAMGTNFACALLTDGSVKCWGRSNYGQLGQGDMVDRGDDENEMGDNLSTVNLGTGKTAKAISAGSAHTCVILNDDTVKCWGYGNNGRLGYQSTINKGDGANEMGDNLAAVNVGSGLTVKSIAAGYSHTCVILNDDTVKCWGVNSYGQLGVSSTAHKGDNSNEMGDNLLRADLGTGKTAKAISAGVHHTCAILNDDTLKCWGRNNYGQLGLEDMVNRGDGANEMGDNLPTINVGAGLTVTQVNAIYYHTCAILNNSSIKCWGYGGAGRLGYESTANKGDGASEMGDNLSAINLGTGKTALGIGGANAHTCIHRSDNKAVCWGYNTAGQLGLGHSTNVGTSAGQMGDNLVAANLGTGLTISKIYHSQGGNFNCVVFNDNQMKCWGVNDYGQLGQGDTANRGGSAVSFPPAVIPILGY